MNVRSPALLIVLVDTARLRWHVAAVSLDGTLVPLLRCDDGNLAPYLRLPFDDQVSFLRHRLCGVLQRGSDRLFVRDMKARQIVFLLSGKFESLLDGRSEGLTLRLAEHLVDWLSNPPVVFYMLDEAPGQTIELPPLAGQPDAEVEGILQSRIADLFATTCDPQLWELVRWKSSA